MHANFGGNRAAYWVSGQLKLFALSQVIVKEGHGREYTRKEVCQWN